MKDQTGVVTPRINSKGKDIQIPPSNVPRTKNAVGVTVQMSNSTQYPFVRGAKTDDKTQENIIRRAIELGFTINNINPIRYALINGIEINEEIREIAVSKKLVPALDYFDDWDEKIKFVNELAEKNVSGVVFSRDDHEQIANFAAENDLDVNDSMNHVLYRTNQTTSHLDNFFYSQHEQNRIHFLEGWARSGETMDYINAFEFAESKDFRINEVPFLEYCISEQMMDSDIRSQATLYAYAKIHEIMSQLDYSQPQDKQDQVYRSALDHIKSTNKQIEKYELSKKQKNSTRKIISSYVFSNEAVMLEYNNQFEKNGDFTNEQLVDWAKASYHSTDLQDSKVARVSSKITSYLDQHPERVKGVLGILLKEYRAPKATERTRQACAIAYDSIAETHQQKRGSSKQYAQLDKLLKMTPQSALYFINTNYGVESLNALAEGEIMMEHVRLIDIERITDELLPNTIEVASKLTDINETIASAKVGINVYVNIYAVRLLIEYIKTIYEGIYEPKANKSKIGQDLYKYSQQEKAVDAVDGPETEVEEMPEQVKSKVTARLQGANAISGSHSMEAKSSVKQKPEPDQVASIKPEEKAEGLVDIAIEAPKAEMEETVLEQVESKPTKDNTTDQVVDDDEQARADVIKGMKLVINRAVVFREKMEIEHEPIYWALGENLPVLDWLKDDEVFHKNVMGYLKDNPGHVPPILKKIAEIFEKLPEAERENADKNYGEIIVDLNDPPIEKPGFVGKMGGPPNKSKAEAVQEERKNAVIEVGVSK